MEKNSTKGILKKDDFDNLQLRAFEVSRETEQRPMNPKIVGLGLQHHRKRVRKHIT